MSVKKQADALLEEAYKKYYADLYRFAMSYLTKDKASIDDCVQEAFIVLYKKYLSKEEVVYTKAFLYRTLENFLRKKLRDVAKSQNQFCIDEITEIPAQASDIDDTLTFEQYSRQISEALSDREAELFRLRYIDEKSLEEISDILGISPSNAGTKVYRLKKKLTVILEDVIPG